MFYGAPETLIIIQLVGIGYRGVNERVLIALVAENPYTHTTLISVSLSYPQIFSINRSVEISCPRFAIIISSI